MFDKHGLDLNLADICIHIFLNNTLLMSGDEQFVLCAMKSYSQQIFMLRFC